jgi:enoyl-CoA hydratase
MTEALILTEIHGDGDAAPALITAQPPQAAERAERRLMDQLGAALLAFDRDDGIGCIVITGSEKAFAAGADISAMARFSYMDVHRGDFITRNWETLLQVRKPVIAAVAALRWAVAASWR